MKIPIKEALLAQFSHGADSPTLGDTAPPLRPALPLLLVPLAFVFFGLLLGERVIAPFEPSGSAGLVFNALIFLRSLIDTDTARSLLITLALPAAILAAAGALVCVLCIRARPLLVILLSLCALTMGCSIGIRYWGSVQESAAALAQAECGGAVLTITSDPRVNTFATTSLAEIRCSDGSRGRVSIMWGDQEPAPQGMRFTASVRFATLKDKEAYLFEQGICGTVSLLRMDEPAFRPDLIGIIHAFRSRNVQILDGISGEGSALLSGVLLGNTERLRSSATDQSFRATGLSHLIAVSGSHLVVIASLLGWVLSRLPGRRGIEIVILIAVLALYVVLTGFQAPAIRAAVMSGISSCSFFARRRAHTPSALCVAGITMLLINPSNTFSVGFWLSICAVFGISLFCPLANSWFAAPIEHVMNTIRQSRRQSVTQQPGKLFRRLRSASRSATTALALTCTAQAATLPIAVPVFAILPLVSPLANLLVTPLVTVMVGGGMLALCLGIVLPTLSHMMLKVLCLVGQGASWAAAKLASIPFAAIPFHLELVPSLSFMLALAAVLYLIWPRPSPKSALKLLLTIAIISSSVLIVIPRFNQPQLIMLDVGQGDAIIIREGSRTLLIDTGANPTQLIQALARSNITQLDAVVITHLDTDHCGALGALRGIVGVDKVVFAAGIPENNPTHAALLDANKLVGEGRVLTMQLGDCIRLSRHIFLELVWPLSAVEKGENADSLCLMLYYDVEADGIPEYAALLTGDAESLQLATMLDEGLITTCDIIKVGHHGSRASVTQEVLARLNVEIALISAGAGNRYGHPNPEAIKALESAELLILRTDHNGDVTITFSASTLRIQCATMG